MLRGQGTEMSKIRSWYIFLSGTWFSNVKFIEHCTVKHLAPNINKSGATLILYNNQMWDVYRFTFITFCIQRVCNFSLKNQVDGTWTWRWINPLRLPECWAGCSVFAMWPMLWSFHVYWGGRRSMMLKLQRIEHTEATTDVVLCKTSYPLHRKSNYILYTKGMN